MTEQKDTEFGPEFFAKIEELRAQEEKDPSWIAESLPPREGDSGRIPIARICAYYQHLIRPFTRTCKFVRIAVSTQGDYTYEEGDAMSLRGPCYLEIAVGSSRSHVNVFINPGRGQLLFLTPMVGRGTIAQEVLEGVCIIANADLTCAYQIYAEDIIDYQMLYGVTAAYVMSIKGFTAKRSLDAVTADGGRLAKQIEKILLP